VIEVTTKLIKCGDCKRSFPVTMTKSGYHSWIMGELIQNALPELSPADRELLISKTCNDCFTEMFSLPE